MFKPPPGCSVQDVAAAIEEMRNPAATPVRLSESELRAQEYRALVNGLEEETEDGDTAARRQFLCTELDLTCSGLPDLVAQVSRVSRLREVRALYGFSRITPVTSEDAVVPVSSSASTWLPAIEVMGEGIFLRFDETRLRSFLESHYARQRHAMLIESHHLAAGDRAGEIDLRMVTLHSLAHILLNELSLTAGYPAASLRERVYAESEQAGILIYTATADSAGSLGGLASLSQPDRLSAVLASAIRRACWCTSDPVCIETPSSGVDGQNLAACHACLLLPETSCEHFNVKLDRALLVGEPTTPDVGLFGTEIADAPQSTPVNQAEAAHSVRPHS